jgi:hypothetical protein
MPKQSKDLFMPRMSDKALRKSIKADKFKNRTDFKKSQKLDKKIKRSAKQK